MARYNDESDVGYTCPFIDDVLEYINSIEWDLSNEDEKELFDEGQKMADKLETVRQAATDLRFWGNEQFKRAEEYEKKVNGLEEEIKSLQNEIALLELTKSELENLKS